MFQTIAIRGDGGSVVQGYLPAVVLGTWNIARTAPPKMTWTLSARVQRVDAFRARQRGLFFTAPRLGGGRWFWPVREMKIAADASSLVAILDHPEQ